MRSGAPSSVPLIYGHMEQEARKVLRVILLRTIPGVGLITELVIVATAGDIDQSRNGWEFTERLKLTPPIVRSPAERSLRLA